MGLDVVELHKRFGEEYERIYYAEDKVEYYEWAVTMGDMLLKYANQFTMRFVEYRRDMLTSDREMAAFAFAVCGMLK